MTMTYERRRRHFTIAFLLAAAVVGPLLLLASTNNNNEPSFHRNNNIMETQRISHRQLFSVESSQLTDPKSVTIRSEKKQENEPELDNQKYWQLQLSNPGRVDCQIHTTPIDSKEVSTPLSSSTTAAPMMEYSIGSQKEQYIIHIHGLHHTGTGYLRQTLHDALNKAFSTGENDMNSSPLASIQDSMRPYQHLMEEARKNQNKSKIQQLYKEYRVPENEGHHLQSVYPQFVDRIKELTRSKGGVENAGKLAYLADLCTISSNDHDAASLQLDSADLSHTNNKKIGNILLQQWLLYWDRSATFLLQKTPTLDVLFLERVKVLPTLHVIIVRHPMTSNSWG
mmetsp:Transcript_10332/g.18652  ORF Transcript_10332/g.18652 Transcript_10332/m.18652 type:complete len:339 (-) Transcript_10332:745-1761(-)